MSRVRSPHGIHLSPGLGAAVAALGLLLPAHAGAQAPAAEVTFARDVAPILQRNCQECHQPGSIGPMSLMTYEEARPWARAIKRQVETREMPPYHYDTNVGIQELKHDRRLSEAEIRTIAAWVDAGAPLGDPADMPPPATFPDPAEWRLAATLGQPDHVVSSTPYTVPSGGQDIWHKPIVPSGFEAEQCIKAIEVKPRVDGRAVSHHANPYWRFPDENGVVQLVGPGGESISEYALGKLGEVVPEDACRVAKPGAMVGWDIHYYPSGQEVKDHVVDVGFWLHEEGHKPKYEQDLKLYPLVGGIDAIPPNTVVMTQGFHSWDHPVRIDSFQPHGHLRLKAMSLEIFHPETGKRELASMVSNWNPGWHLSHIYEDHVAPLVPKGSVMILTGWYDNTANNRHNPDPDQWVYRGSRTGDEMSHGWIAVTHLDQEGYDRLVAERQQQRQDRPTDD